MSDGLNKYVVILEDGSREEVRGRSPDFTMEGPDRILAFKVFSYNRDARFVNPQGYHLVEPDVAFPPEEEGEGE